jgi:four helix bundle protein
LTKEIYKISNLLPAEERFNMVQQIRRAGLSVMLNFAEGSTRKSNLERKRYYEISRGSIVEIDAALETAVDLEYFKVEPLQQSGILLNECFAMPSKMMEQSK